MPLLALHRRFVLGNDKMATAPDLSLRGRSAPVDPRHFLALRSQATAPLGPRNDMSGGASAPVPPCGLIPLYKALAPRKGGRRIRKGGKAANGCAQSERRYRRNRCVPLYRYSMRAASVAPGEACLAPANARLAALQHFQLSIFRTCVREFFLNLRPFKYSNFQFGRQGLLCAPAVHDGLHRVLQEARHLRRAAADEGRGSSISPPAPPGSAGTAGRPRCGRAGRSARPRVFYTGGRGVGNARAEPRAAPAGRPRFTDSMGMFSAMNGSFSITRRATTRL